MLPRVRGVGLLARFIILAIFVDFAFAATVTVDDADPAITYSANNGWNIGNNCSQCTAQPSDRTQIYDQTWHDNTKTDSQADIWFQTTFTGTSVTVYGILIDIIATGFITNTDLTLNLDGETSSYTYTPVSRNSYQYKVPVFTKTGLSNTQHTIRVTLNQNSAFLFDYLVYTTPDASVSSVMQAASTSSTSTGISSVSLSNSPSSSSSSSPSPSSSSSPSSSPSSYSTLGGLSVSIDAFGSTHFVSPTADASSSGSSTFSIGTTVGTVTGIIGVILIVIAIFILLFTRCRKRRRDLQDMGTQPMATGDGHGISEALMMQSTGPTALPHASAKAPHGASTTKLAPNGISATYSGNRNSSFNSLIGGASVSTGTEPVFSHTSAMSTSSGDTDHYDLSDSNLLSRSTAAPGVGGRDAPWNMASYPRGILAPVQPVAPVPVRLGDPMSSGRDSEDRSGSAVSGVTRLPSAPPPYTPS